MAPGSPAAAGLPPTVAGLGFRRELLAEMQAGVPACIEFFELAPENWLGVGGRSAKALRGFSERYPFVCHGLSLDLGGFRPLDAALLRAIARFMAEHGMDLYSEHLSWCADEGMLYDLLPIPLTGDAVRHTAARIRQAQDILGRRIAIENASTYVRPAGAEMSESEFIRAVLDEAGCALHLDINNVYVNSVNHGFDPLAFIRSLPAERVVYMHMAGHQREAPDLLVDTHGADVVDPVWCLFEATCELLGPRPTLLERDFNIPPLATLSAEVGRIGRILRAAKTEVVHA